LMAYAPMLILFGNVNANIAGMSPLKPGVKGEVPAWAFKTLCVAFVSYVQIQQINSREGEISYKKLAQRINQVHREIDMSETYLGRYAALQKRNAVAADLDFSTKE
jgi:hypothetical protein